MNMFIVSLIITILFILYKIIDYRTSQNKDNKEIGRIIRDSVVVFLCSVGGLYVSNKYTQLFEKPLINETPEVLTDIPAF